MEAAEFELKFEVSDKALPRIVEQLELPAPSQTSRLRSTYFDTPERDLRNACLGLRVRQTEAGLMQNLKWEGHSSPFVRHEWETEVRSNRPDPAALANTPAGDVLDGNGRLLEPIFTTTVERTRHVWTKGDDMVEVSLDRGEITSGTRREPIQELELELKAGDPKAVFELASSLSKRVKLPLMFQSKADRGYRLADDQGWQPERALPIFIPPETPAGDAFREVAHTCLGQVANNARLVSLYRSLEALHQVRVGLRRFRAALTIFRPFIEDGGEYERIRAETKWLTTELDAARDIDVFIHESFRCVSPKPADREAFARLGAQLLHGQSEAYDRALAALASPRFARLVLTTTRWLEIGAWTRSDEPVIKRLREGRTDEFAQDQLDRMRRQVRRGGRRLAHLDAQSHHRLRIKAKKLRYAAGFFAESFGRKRRRNRFLKALGHLQDALGRIHDTNVAPQLALKIAGGRSAKAGFAAGLIVAKRRASGARDERAALKAFARFNGVKPFWS
jgi:inorganic triphosphatase YgiF